MVEYLAVAVGQGRDLERVLFWEEASDLPEVMGEEIIGLQGVQVEVAVDALQRLLFSLL